MTTKTDNPTPDTTGQQRSFGEKVAFFSLSAPAVLILSAMILIPLLETVGRRVAGVGVTGAANWVQHLTLWIALLGGILATKNGGHLSMGVTELLRQSSFKKYITLLVNIGVVIILFCLIQASIQLVIFQYESPETLSGWLPIWLAQSLMPLGLAGMLLFTLVKSSRRWSVRLAAFAVASIVAIALLTASPELPASITTIGCIAILLMAVLGMPLYAVLGGLATLLFMAADVTIVSIPAETYRILTQPVLPSIPLFTLCGTILAAGGAPARLLRVIKAWTGWLPGGAAISTVIGCAFFTAITGASGVTILALGGLLLPVLIGANLGKRFSTGLLTASGSVGLLFPPSLPVILYGVYGHVPIDRLFLGALVPGLLLVLLLTGFSLFRGRKHIKERPPFQLREALQATWAAKGDFLLPIIVILGLFGGIMTLVETAAFTALWAILLETVFHRKLNFRKTLPKVIIESASLVGALLMVLGIAAGLVSYLIDAQIPQAATEWVMRTISSKLVFLLALNGMLLLVGALMDIFSAIVIVVPLIAPMGVAFGVDPVHLGVIFLANLELGYLTPPVGLNLFLSSLRFEQPLLEVWRTVIPFLVIFVIWVLLIVYVPALTVGVAGLLGQ